MVNIEQYWTRGNSRCAVIFVTAGGLGCVIVHCLPFMLRRSETVAIRLHGCGCILSQLLDCPSSLLLKRNEIGVTEVVSAVLGYLIQIGLDCADMFVAAHQRDASAEFRCDRR